MMRIARFQKMVEKFRPMSLAFLTKRLTEIQLSEDGNGVIEKRYDIFFAGTHRPFDGAGSRPAMAT